MNSRNVMPDTREITTYQPYQRSVSDSNKEDTREEVSKTSVCSISTNDKLYQELYCYKINVSQFLQPLGLRLELFGCLLANVLPGRCVSNTRRHVIRS